MENIQFVSEKPTLEGYYLIRYKEECFRTNCLIEKYDLVRIRKSHYDCECNGMGKDCFQCKGVGFYGELEVLSSNYHSNNDLVCLKYFNIKDLVWSERLNIS